MHPIIVAVLLVWWTFPATVCTVLAILYRLPVRRIRSRRHAR